MVVVAVLLVSIVYFLLPDSVLSDLVQSGFNAVVSISDIIYNAVRDLFLR